MTNRKWPNHMTSWRESAGLTVAEAAEAFGVSEYVYRRWETREIEPTATALLSMPDVFGVKRSVVLTLEEV